MGVAPGGPWLGLPEWTGASEWGRGSYRGRTQVPALPGVGREVVQD